MNRTLLLFLLLLISSSCKIDSTDVINDPSNIPDAIKERISALELIKADERILTVIHKTFTKIPSFETTEDGFLLLTDERFLRYYTYDGKKEVQEIQFSNCLEIAFDSITLMSGDYIKYDISAKSIYKLMYNENDELKLLPDFKDIHYGDDIKYQADFQTLNSLVIKAWKNHPSYDSLRSIYKKFYDEKGNYRTD
jgi:hypothetical protein